MAYNNGVPYGSYRPPNGNSPMMNNQNRHYGPPRFNNNSLWRPGMERPNFNISRFMHPPHMVQRPEFAAGNMFGQETAAGPRENFPYSGQQNIPGQQVNAHQNGWGQQVNGHQSSQGQQVNGHQNSWGQQVNAPQFNGQEVNGYQGQQFNGHQNSWSQQSNSHHPSPGQQRFKGPNFQSQQLNGHGQQLNGHGQQFNGQCQQFKGQNFRGQPGRGRGHNRGRGGPSGGFNNTQQQHSTGNSKKKEKVDKRDLPENNAFYCDICDRGFKSEDKHKEHVDGHTKCSYADCPFIAAPKLVQMHVRLQHGSGMAKKVWSMESEEDVKKWREERKRNFPTTETVARKKEERAEKMARGEVLETREFGKMGRGRGKNRRGGRGKGRWKNRGQGDRNESEYQAADSGDDDSPPVEMKIKKTTEADDDQEGCSTAQTGTTTVDDEAPTAVAGDIPETAPPPTESGMDTSENGLSLLASYGESGDEGEGSGEEASVRTVAPPSTPAPTILPNPITPPSVQSSHSDNLSPSKKEVTNLNSQTNVNLSPHKALPCDTAAEVSSTDTTPIPGCSKEEDEDSRISTNKHDHSGTESERPNTGGKRGPQSRHEDGPSAKRNKKEPGKQSQRAYTLLQKLLAPDMRRERNKILQCVHFIVKNKFFEAQELASTNAPVTD